MADELAALREAPFADAAGAMVDLLSRGSRAFLLGAGCSKCAAHPLTGELTDAILKADKLADDTQSILGELKVRFEGAAGATIEDFMSELVDLIAIAQRRSVRSAKEDKVRLGKQEFSAQQLTTGLQDIKGGIVGLFNTIASDPKIHWSFVRAVHRTLRRGKTMGSRPVDYIVLNYDTLLEDALGLERIHFSDGFRGGGYGWWDLRSFDDPTLQARILKVHGSIDWCSSQPDAAPRRIRKRPLPACLGPSDDILIYPAATKYQETQRDPYAQVFGIVRETLRPAVGTEAVLAICGYAFGDDHVNAELDRALREAEGRLTVLVLTELEKLPSLVQTWTEDMGLREQVRVYSRKGFIHGEVQAASESDLPWWTFECLTRLLGGEK